MKKVLFSMAILCLVTSCAVTHGGYYDISLKEVNCQNKRGGISGTRKYANDIIEIMWDISNTKLGFILKNKSKENIKVIWDEALFIDTDNSSNRIIHSGVKYADKENAQVPTVITSGSYIDDLVIPTKNIYYESFYNTFSFSVGWREKTYLPMYDKNKNRLIKAGTNYVGQTFKIILPIQVSNTTYNHEFLFSIDNFNFVH
jgi:hypothetical protein